MNVWIDFRVTNYASIERLREVILSSYFIISWHANNFKHQIQTHISQTISNSTSAILFEQHTRWEAGTTSEKCFEQLTLAGFSRLFFGACLNLCWIFFRFLDLNVASSN